MISISLIFLPEGKVQNVICNNCSTYKIIHNQHEDFKEKYSCLRNLYSDFVWSHVEQNSFFDLFRMNLEVNFEFSMKIEKFGF